MDILILLNDTCARAFRQHGLAAPEMESVNKLLDANGLAPRQQPMMRGFYVDNAPGSLVDAFKNCEGVADAKKTASRYIRSSSTPAVRRQGLRSVG